MKIFITVLVTLAVLVLGAVAVAYSGFVDVSATGTSWAPVDWFLNTTRESSVESRLDDIQVPPLDDPAKLRIGLEHYHEMCVTCHGAPGVEPAELAQGLNPTPPEFGRPRRHRQSSEDRDDAATRERREEHAKETFWIVKHGIRMTGMPAFGPTHTDDQIWAITAFLQRMRDLSPDEYAAMVRNAGLESPSGEEHEHDEMGDDSGGGAAGEAMPASGDEHDHDDGHAPAGG